MLPTRSPLTVAFSVWKALFLREALTRLLSARAAWFWLLAEPLFHLAFLAFLFSVVNVHTVGGIATSVWLLLGLIGFFSFRRTATQTMYAIASNRALFAYRQVKPVDTAIARAALEGALMACVAAVVWVGAALVGIAVMPADPLGVLLIFFGMWLAGFGFGLIALVALELVPEVGQLIGLAMLPLYLLSGVLVPIATVPQPWREWLMLNPLAHGVEASRLAFAPHYHAPPELSLGYFALSALALTFFGLALNRRFAIRLATIT